MATQRSAPVITRENGNNSAYKHSAYGRLLNTICVGYGYCGSEIDGRLRHVDDFIPAEGPVSADQFATWVFLAEGLDPLLADISHRRAIRRAFIEFMDTNVVDATLLK
jgi:hypothetical protein